MIVIARFGKTLGLNGDIYIHSFFSNKFDILEYKDFFLDGGSTLTMILTKSNRKLVGKILNVDTVDKAKNYTGKLIYIKKDDLPILKPNQHYYEELIDMKVFINKKKIGIIKNVLNHGAGDYFEIKVKKAEIVVPLNKDHVLNINKKTKCISLNPLYYEL